MTTITATRTPTEPRTARTWRRAQVRATLTRVVREGTTMASAAWHRKRRPALVIGSFTSIDIAAWHTLGTGAGWLVLGILGLAFELLGGEE